MIETHRMYVRLPWSNNTVIRARWGRLSTPTEHMDKIVVPHGWGPVVLASDYPERSRFASRYLAVRLLPVRYSTSMGAPDAFNRAILPLVPFSAQDGTDMFAQPSGGGR